MKGAVALACGLVIGYGLILSDIVTPENMAASVLQLDDWFYSMEVLVGIALAVGVVGIAIIRAQTNSELGAPTRLRVAQGGQHRLILGSVLSGIGWGLLGISLSPAVNLLGVDLYQLLLFATAVLVGIALVDIADRKR